MWIQKIPGGGVEGLVYAPDGRTLHVADRGGAFTAWDVVARAGKRLFVQHSMAVRGIALAGRYLIAQSYPFVLAWDLIEGKEAARLNQPNPQDDLPLLGNDRVAYQSADRRSLLAWNPARGSEGEPFTEVVPNPIRAYDLSPDAKIVAFSCDHSNEVVVYDVALRTVATKFMVPTIHGTVWGLRFSPDGARIAVFCGIQIHIWDISHLKRVGEPVSIENRHGKRAFAFHPTAPIFVALDRRKNLTLFSLETGVPIRSLDFGLGRFVKCVAFSPDGLTCAVGGSNKQFAVFDVDV